MEVQLSDAADTIDRFESLLGCRGISISQKPQTGADMLSTWALLQRIRAGFSGLPDDIRGEFTAAVAAHDLAAKVLSVENTPSFDQLVPHLEMLANGAIHLTEPPPAVADGYNKLIELYWACLCLSFGSQVELDHPTHSDGLNPDVVTWPAGGGAKRSYAFKTIRSPHNQSVLEHIKKGVDQIERSDSDEGIVALHLTPRISNAGIWPMGGYYQDWRAVAIKVMSELKEAVSGVVADNGPAAIAKIFEDKKAAGQVLCLAFAPTVARSPVSGKAVVMPLKVAVLVELDAQKGLSKSFQDEIVAANDAMQLIL